MNIPTLKPHFRRITKTLYGTFSRIFKLALFINFYITYICVNLNLVLFLNLKFFFIFGFRIEIPVQRSHSPRQKRSG